MSKRGLLAVAGFLALCVSLSAQDFASVQPDRFSLNPSGLSAALNARPAPGQADLFGTLNNAWDGPAPLTLADGRIFSFPSAFAWMEATPADFLPAVALQEPVRVAPAARLTQDSGNKAVDLLPRFDYAGGEVSVFYGKSTGKFSREIQGGSLLSEIVDGNTHIIVGASYEHSSGRVPNFFPR